jgi:hypothetical protein
VKLTLKVDGGVRPQEAAAALTGGGVAMQVARLRLLGPELQDPLSPAPAPA